MAAWFNFSISFLKDYIVLKLCQPTVVCANMVKQGYKDSKSVSAAIFWILFQDPWPFNKRCIDQFIQEIGM